MPGETSGDHDCPGKRMAKKHRKYQNEQNQQNVEFSAAVCMLGNGETEVCVTLAFIGPASATHHIQMSRMVRRRSAETAHITRCLRTSRCLSTFR